VQNVRDFRRTLLAVDFRLDLDFLNTPADGPPRSAMTRIRASQILFASALVVPLLQHAARAQDEKFGEAGDKEKSAAYFRKLAQLTRNAGDRVEIREAKQFAAAK
jgi:hypothetical protein